MFDWQFDHGRANVFLAHMKAIVGEALIGAAPKEEDQKHNTDLIVLRLEAVRIACRVRDLRYLDRYPDEFTIRQSRPSGVDSELGKIMFGWGDYILYGFGDLTAKPSPSARLQAWLLGDLKVFRKWYYERLLSDGTEPGERQENGDGSSIFRAFRIDDLPPTFVLRRQRPKVSILDGNSVTKEAS